MAVRPAVPDVASVGKELKRFTDSLMSAEADALCGAKYGAISSDRVNRRNGYRDRDWDTRAGTIEPRVPKLREGTGSA